VTVFEVWLALLRGLHVATMLSASGALLFLAMMPRGRLADPRRLVAIVVRASLAAALVLGTVWLIFVAQSIAGGSVVDVVGTLPLVLHATRFGELLAIRLVLLAIALATVRADGRRIALPLGASAAALLLQPFLGHAGAADDWALAATETLHLGAAAAWLGGLLPLWLLVDRLPAIAGLAVARRFSPVALAGVLVIAGTALIQAAALIGSVAGLIGTDYGRAALMKLALFAALLGLATLNRFVFTGRAAEARPYLARRRLRTSIALELVLGLAVVLAAGVLASLPPPAEAMPMPQH
jgi:putative copper export protein